MDTPTCQYRLFAPIVLRDGWRAVLTRDFWRRSLTREPLMSEVAAFVTATGRENVISVSHEYTGVITVWYWGESVGD